MKSTKQMNYEVRRARRRAQRKKNGARRPIGQGGRPIGQGVHSPSHSTYPPIMPRNKGKDKMYRYKKGDKKNGKIMPR